MVKNIKCPVSVLKSEFSFAGIIPALLILNSLLILSSCTEEYWPDLGEKYDELLVVEGMVTNAPGPYTIKLTQSTSIRYPREIPLTGYGVIISDNAGNSETLTETEEGTYTTAPGGIQGVVGRSYKLTIHGLNGTTYESGFEKLTPPVAIDTLYPVVEFRENENFSFGIP
ncbi:MAG: DUF4249 family protein, partial [Bacteroidales bacterium]|nr:DUF4249 family protein [Bacteroidales bacterium]